MAWHLSACATAWSGQTCAQTGVALAAAGGPACKACGTSASTATMGGQVRYFFSHLLDTSSFPPRWHCGTWQSLHGWLHIVSDVAIWAAYFAIPCVLVYFVRKRKDAPFPRIYWLFGMFIFACGTVHLIEATIFWWPIYRVSAVFKMLTAIVSWATVAALIPLIPKALALPGAARLNVQLEDEIQRRTAVEKQLSLTIEASPVAMLTSNPAGRIVFANSEALHLFGYSKDEMTGLCIDALVPNRVRTKHTTYRTEFVRNPEARAMGAGRDLFAMRRDGTEFPVEIGLSPIESPAGVLVLSTVVDITERKRAKKKLTEYAGQLERSNRQLEQFAYIVSHDLKAPLRGITSLADILAEDLAELMNTDAREHLELMRDRSDRMAQLIDGILQYSRAGQQQINRKIIDTHRLVLEVIDLIHPPNHVRVSIDGTLPQVCYDETQLRQVLQNLIGNAIQHLDKPDGQVLVSCAQRHGEVQFSVSDNGVGIPAKHFERIFQLFQTVKSAENRRSTGIGLSIVKCIVERNGGRITVQSQEGQGATFSFTVPANPIASGDGAVQHLAC